MTRRPVLLTAVLVTALTLAACGTGTADGANVAGDGTDAPDGHNEADTDGGAELSGELTVFAAASLNVVFEDIAEIFMAEHPETSVRFSFAGSSDIVAQLDAGAPADVLAAANESTMADAVANGTIEGEPEVFADNVLTLIALAGNPAGVTGLDESLAAADLVVCAPQVPCGQATNTLTSLLDVALEPVSEEGSVTDVLGKVSSGQADAGLVYTTDAAAAGDRVETIEVYDQDDEVINSYSIALTAGSDHSELARAWVDFVQGPAAQDVLDAAGFGTP